MAVASAPNGVQYTSYWNWDAGFGLTYKAFTLDLRYYGTNLTSARVQRLHQRSIRRLFSGTT